MLRKSTHAVRRPFGSTAAMALALAAGGVLGSAAISAPAFAKDKKEEKKEEERNSKAFAKAYEPYANLVNGGEADYAAAKDMIPTVEATIENDQDRFVMGQSMISLGGKMKDQGLQKQGIAMSLASGKTPQQQVGMFNYFLGQWAYQDKNWPEARDRFEKAIAAGYSEGDPDVLITETYFGQDQNAEGLEYFSNLLDKRKAAGEKVPDQWIMRGLKVAVDSQMPDKIVEYSTRLVENSPTPQHWSDAIQLVASTSEPDKQGTIDMLRLMRATGALTKRNQYVEYVETASDSMPSEVVTVLTDGKQAGIFSDNDGYYTDAMKLAKQRSAKDEADAKNIAAEAQAAATGVTAQGAGDLFFSLGQYGKAADMYQLALDKGPRDKDLAMIRKGISQVLAGQGDAGKATLAQVAGKRAAIAKLWIAFADTQEAPAAAAAPAA